MSLLLCGSCIGCRSQREYSTSCACLCTRCSAGTLPITLPACWRLPLTFLHGRRCVHRITVTWLYQERVGRLRQDFLCYRTPCLESATDRLVTLAFNRFIQQQTEELSVSCCLYREHCVNCGMRHRSDCRGRTYKSLLLLLLLLYPGDSKIYLIPALMILMTKIFLCIFESGQGTVLSGHYVKLSNGCFSGKIYNSVLTMYKTLVIDWLIYVQNIVQPSFVSLLDVVGPRHLP